VYLGAVIAAKDKVAQQFPNYFVNNNPSSGCIKANYRDRYDDAVVAKLNQAGLRAINDAGGEIAVKGGGVAKGTGFSEQFHLLFSNACIHPCNTLRSGCYRATCVPAWFN
jgi:hypothetical protein